MCLLLFSHDRVSCSIAVMSCASALCDALCMDCSAWLSGIGTSGHRLHAVSSISHEACSRSPYKRPLFSLSNLVLVCMLVFVFFVPEVTEAEPIRYTTAIVFWILR